MSPTPPLPNGTRILLRRGGAKNRPAQGRTGTVEGHHYNYGYLCYQVLLDATDTERARRYTYPASQIEPLPQPDPTPCAS